MASNNENPKKRPLDEAPENDSKKKLIVADSEIPETKIIKNLTPLAASTPASTSSMDTLPPVQYLPDDLCYKHFQQIAVVSLARMSSDMRSNWLYTDDDIMHRELNTLLNEDLHHRKCEDEQLNSMVKKLAFMRATLNYLFENSGHPRMDFCLHTSPMRLVEDFDRVIKSRKPSVAELQKTD